MIVLDEQLLSYGVRDPMARWYRGRVLAITQLRPQTVIRDDAIPMLLRAARQPTFVTINVGDFWRRLSPDPRFCLACIAVSHTQALEVPLLVRRLFRLAPFRTQRQRLGTIIRVSPRQVQYYTATPPVIHRLAWPRAR
jgi:hypothetical protein